jgi:hypothetical protein
VCDQVLPALFRELPFPLAFFVFGPPRALGVGRLFLPLGGALNPVAPYRLGQADTKAQRREISGPGT